jgi:hypothetical protein
VRGEWAASVMCEKMLFKKSKAPNNFDSLHAIDLKHSVAHLNMVGTEQVLHQTVASDPWRANLMVNTTCSRPRVVFVLYTVDGAQPHVGSCEKATAKSCPMDHTSRPLA